MDSILIFGLALILFGPRKLPEIGRQIGKIVYEFRKASNEFKMQIEDELRASEQADRQKKIAEETAALTSASAASSTAGVIPIAAALTPETSAPSDHPDLHTLTVQPPSIGEQVSTGSPYSASGYYTESEPLAAVIVESPGEDPNPDAIAELYPVADSAPGLTEDAAASQLETAPSDTRDTVEAPIQDSSVQIHSSHTPSSQEIDQATTQHG